jgi:hypothetical protein
LERDRFVANGVLLEIGFERHVLGFQVHDVHPFVDDPDAAFAPRVLDPSHASDPTPRSDPNTCPNTCSNPNTCSSPNTCSDSNTSEPNTLATETDPDASPANSTDAKAINPESFTV